MFGAEVAMVVKKAYPNQPLDQNELTKTNYFIRGLNEDVGRMLRAREPQNLETAVELANTIAPNILNSCSSEFFFSLPNLSIRSF